jgi:hypothetical protein
MLSRVCPVNDFGLSRPLENKPAAGDSQAGASAGAGAAAGGGGKNSAASAPAPELTMQSEGAGPLRWMARESLIEHTFSKSTDVWMFGVRTCTQQSSILCSTLRALSDIPSRLARSSLLAFFRTSV